MCYTNIPYYYNFQIPFFVKWENAIFLFQPNNLVCYRNEDNILFNSFLFLLYLTQFINILLTQGQWIHVGP